MIKLDQIRKAKALIVVLISRDGPELLPLFLRLEAEEAAAENVEGGLKRALKLARLLRTSPSN